MDARQVYQEARSIVRACRGGQTCVRPYCYMTPDGRFGVGEVYGTLDLSSVEWASVSLMGLVLHGDMNYYF